ncbi:uncharacterized protein LTR77_006520 [Saxophila tyrrhenica]|uniref:NADH:ubiquinone oxidoreductase intermediate-associated protein 30 domain-containing protein n=1 Tax=Saxophila tyrrhenica TaxID=1690608 RepID=A0AAV9P802_9PEZI|nr:hypothetical protein LTR77_006520 [Saxophila tyrrhenica]
MDQYSDDKKESRKLTLFGGSVGWSPEDWTASDDSVRGGKSESHLEIDGDTARFHGTLDIKTLGGAGFASQRTTGDDREWNLSDYAGIQLDVAKGDKKRYTFILKDELLPPDEKSGREQSTISWECDFELPPQTKPGDVCDKSVYIPWDSLNPTYRGKLKKDADPLDLKKIKRISIMMRSFFGSQEGDFSLKIKTLAALEKAPKSAGLKSPSVYDPQRLEDGTNAIAQQPNRPLRGPGSSWLADATVQKSALTIALVVGALLLYKYPGYLYTRGR